MGSGRRTRRVGQRAMVLSPKSGHPRGAGTYARVLGHYVREQQSLTLMDALSRMTILPARRLESFVPQMAKRGRVARGAFADLTVLDPAKGGDRAPFPGPSLPAGMPAGYSE